MENSFLVHVVQCFENHVDYIFDSVDREVPLAVGDEIKKAHVHQFKNQS